VLLIWNKFEIIGIPKMQNPTHSTTTSTSRINRGVTPSSLLDQPIPLTTQRRLDRRDPPLIRTPTKKELKRLQKQFKTNVVTRRVNKAFNQNLTDYQLTTGESDVQDLEIFFSDIRPYVKQLVRRKLKRYRPTGAGDSFDLVMVTSIRNR